MASDSADKFGFFDTPAENRVLFALNSPIHHGLVTKSSRTLGQNAGQPRLVRYVPCACAEKAPPPPLIVSRRSAPSRPAAAEEALNPLRWLIVSQMFWPILRSMQDPRGIGDDALAQALAAKPVARQIALVSDPRLLHRKLMPPDMPGRGVFRRPGLPGGGEVAVRGRSHGGHGMLDRGVTPDRIAGEMRDLRAAVRALFEAPPPPDARCDALSILLAWPPAHPSLRRRHRAGRPAHGLTWRRAARLCLPRKLDDRYAAPTGPASAACFRRCRCRPTPSGSTCAGISGRTGAARRCPMSRTSI